MSEVDTEIGEPSNVLVACDRGNCTYVVYGAPGGEEEAEDLLADHLRQHDDPEGWKVEVGQVDGADLYPATPATPDEEV